MPLSSDILAWNDQLRSQYANFFSTAQEVVDYMMPTHKGITTIDTPGTRKTERIFDSTAGNSVFLLCSFLAGSLFSQAFEWFTTRHPDEELNKDREVSAYFQASKEVQLASFRQSNFYATAIELLTDWVVFGNMCVLQERLELKPPNQSRLVFTPVGFGSYVFFEGLDKRPEGLIREVEMSAMECMRKFGDGCSEQIKSAAEKTPFKMFRIVHSITPRELVKYKKLATPKEMPWASCWFEHGKKGQKPLLESGYHYKPFAIARYNVIAGEVMGRGLGEIVLPSTKTLNRIIMRGFIDLDKGLDPPIDSTPGNIIGDYSHKSGARNIMRNLNNTRTAESGLQARQRNATYEWNVQDLRTQIETVLLTRQIIELTGIAGGPVKEKTAYQYSKELELLHLIMAPTGGRLQSEGLEDIVETNYAINFRLGTLPELPQALVEAAQTQQGNQYMVVYEGPLAQSQRSQQLGTMQEFLGTVGGLADSFAPQAADIPDVDAFVRKEAEIRGLQSLLYDAKQTDQIRKMKEQIMQLQAQLQMAQQVADVAKSAAPMVSALQQGQNGKQAA